MASDAGRAEPSADPPTVQSLVRLRLLAEDAVRRASDISEAGRHQALIALDGACEHALWLAARHEGMHLTQRQQSGLPALHSAIVEHRSGWTLRGWSGVNQMHEARNSAQHAGVAPDVQQLVAWTDAAIGFINSLCVAASNTELKDVLLAGAVRDQELRALLTRAESSVEDDTQQSLIGITRARGRTNIYAATPAPALDDDREAYLLDGLSRGEQERPSIDTQLEYVLPMFEGTAEQPASVTQQLARDEARDRKWPRQSYDPDGAPARARSAVDSDSRTDR